MLRRKRLADLPEHWDFGELTPGAQVRVRRTRTAAASCSFGEPSKWTISPFPM